MWLFLVKVVSCELRRRPSGNDCGPIKSKQMDAGRLHGLLEGACPGLVISGIMQSFPGL